MEGKGKREGERECGGRCERREWAESLRQASDIQKWSPRSALVLTETLF
jgi:hypothetical protein